MTVTASKSGSVQYWTEPGTGIKQFGTTSFKDLAAIYNKQTISEAGAIDLDAHHVEITGPASGTYAVTLAAPTRGGQVLVLECVAMTGTSVTLALTNVIGGSAGSTATFDAADEVLTLVSAGSAWVVLDEHGVTLS